MPYLFTFANMQYSTLNVLPANALKPLTGDANDACIEIFVRVSRQGGFSNH